MPPFSALERAGCRPCRRRQPGADRWCAAKPASGGGEGPVSNRDGTIRTGIVARDNDRVHPEDERAFIDTVIAHGAYRANKAQPAPHTAGLAESPAKRPALPCDRDRTVKSTAQGADGPLLEQDHRVGTSNRQPPPTGSGSVSRGSVGSLNGSVTPNGWIARNPNHCFKTGRRQVASVRALGSVILVDLNQGRRRHLRRSPVTRHARQV